MQIVLQCAFHYSFCFMNRDIRKTKEIHWTRRMHWVFFANEQVLQMKYFLASLKCAVIPQHNRRGHSSKIFPTLPWSCQVGLPLGVIVPVWCRQKATFTFSQESTITKMAWPFPAQQLFFLRSRIHELYLPQTLSCKSRKTFQEQKPNKNLNPCL